LDSSLAVTLEDAHTVSTLKLFAARGARVTAPYLFGRDKPLPEQPRDDGFGHDPAAYERQLRSAKWIILIVQ
jgi:hypothetical protein